MKISLRCLLPFLMAPLLYAEASVAPQHLPLYKALCSGNEKTATTAMEEAQGEYRFNNAFFELCGAAINQGDVNFFAKMAAVYLDEICGPLDSPFAEVDGHPKSTHYFAAPLLHAAAAGKTEIVRVLLQRGANREETEYYDRTAIVYAAANGHLPCVQLLHQAGADKADIALQAALHFKQMHVAEYLQSHGVQLPAVGDVSLSLAQRTPTGETVLMQAVQSGNVEQVAYALEEAPHWVNCQNSYGRTALMMARNAATTRLLLDYGADANIKDDTGYTALDHAFERRDAEVVQLLMSAEALYAQASPALLYACYTADAALARRVLAEHPADVNMRDSQGLSLLSLAVRSRSSELVRLLLDAGARVAGSGALAVAIAHDDVNWVREFMWQDSVTMKPDVSVTQGNPRQRHLNALLQLALLKRAVNTQKMLINMGADKCGEWIIPLPNYNRYTRVDPNAVCLPKSRYDKPGLTLNFEREDERDSQALPMLGVSESGAVQMDTRRLYGAIVRNDVSMVRMLVRSGGGLCATGSETVACLRAALRGSSPHEVLPLLLQAGADINAVDAEGNTLLILLALDSYHEAELLNLLAYSPNVNVQKDGKSVFEIALEHKRLLFALHMLRNGAAPTQRQLQCFFFAVLREHPEHAAELLTCYGASPTEPEPSTGLTPMDIATRSGNAALVSLLQSALNK
ncbi:MAG: ankyrin repeat domain-containing protein [Akkermansia sp.]|nr:ankyrin repeat domain-containing protein [Akkermansia sp.]